MELVSTGEHPAVRCLKSTIGQIFLFSSLEKA